MRHRYDDIPHRTSISLIEVHMLGGWLVTGVEVAAPFRGNGYAADLLDRVCRDADAEGKRLFLEISPDGTGLNEEALDRLYAARGFTLFDEQDPMSRVREPQEVA